jgi:hypothetical protein
MRKIDVSGYARIRQKVDTGFANRIRARFINVEHFLAVYRIPLGRECSAQRAAM